MKDQIVEIKDKIDCISYARDILGFGVKKDGDRWTSLKPSSTNKTCTVFYRDHFYDYNLGVGGDVINLCAYTKYGGNKAAAIRELANLCGVKLNGVGDWRKKTQNLNNCVQKWHEELKPHHRKYLNKRGFTDETITRNKLGSKGDNIIIPCFENDYVAYYTENMFIDGKPATKESGVPKYKHLALNKAPVSEMTPWGFHTLNREDKPLIITEGIYDAMSCDQEGYQTISALGGTFNRVLYKRIISICRNAKEVILVFDKDEKGAGQKFLFEMATKIFNHNIDFYVYEFDKNEDLNDYYQREGNLKALERGKRRGIEYLAEKIDDKKEFKQFVRRASRFVGKADLSEVFDIVAEKHCPEKFSAGWLKEVKKQAMSAPTEDYIAGKLVKDHDYIYNTGIGFLEYSTGCWREREDEEIQAHIANELGHYRTGAKIGSILKLLKAEAISRDALNKKHILNFLNGTLNLKTGELMQHTKEDMSSIQIKYSYDKEFTCPRWLEFIDEITEQDEEKANLLQEIGGYIMYPDNSLQKAFILIGGGSNGKSVFLETIRKVFGEGNATSVEVSNLNEDFQKIRLMNSLLNVSTEMKSNVGGAESIFKSIVAGDTISGCKKHKGHLDFNPRTKMLCATNEMLKPKDLTHGFLRRLLFIKFNLEFKTIKEYDRDKSYHRIADPHLMDALEDELPGIFNWCYAGYKRLQKQNGFSEPREHKNLIRELKGTANPHQLFFDDLSFEEYREEALWNEYQVWCNRVNYLPKGKPEFFVMADSGMNKRFEGDTTIFIRR